MKDKILISRGKDGIHKWSAKFKDGTIVDFGLQGYSDYTLHKTPSRMRSYVRRHGGIVSDAIGREDDPIKIQTKMLTVKKSDKENWGPSGVKTAGFWSRWLTWSYPNINDAVRFIEKDILKNKYHIKLTK